ncbi:MAG: SWIM zinc finger family protein [Planctomycetaceae bacterium]|jgi:uncharacterized Zn finger protein|nr:SWIM zinc finger family protein [Planctomycetaceae bacterium]
MYYDFAPYVPVAIKLENARKFARKKLNDKVKPIILANKKISVTFWGKAWCTNLENYAELLNRLERGRTYVRNGSVVHLEINKGDVLAYVAGSETYTVEIKIDQLKQKDWKNVQKKCAGKIESAIELLQGRLSDNVLSIITDPKSGLFPSEKELHFNCSCPDGFGGWLCKHVAAVLYGIGSRLDKEPELFFILRGVDHLELIDTNVKIKTGKKDKETLDESTLSDIFGIELSDTLNEKPKKTAKKVAKKIVKKVEKKIPKKKTSKKTTKKVTPKKTTKKIIKKNTKKTKK